MIFIIETLLIILSIFYFIISVWLVFGILKIRKNQRPILNSSKLPKVSIIIAARNEEKNIKQCIESCINQNYPEDRFEIIVVNDRSEDATKAIIENLAKKHKNVYNVNITKLPQEYIKSGKKHALKIGIEKASGAILLFTDADCYPGKQWVKSMAQYFDDEVGVVVGHSPYKGKGFINHLIQLDNLSIIAVGAGGIGGGYPILSVGRNFAYRLEVYNEIGGFDKIKEFSSGDDDLMLMLARQYTNWKIKFASDPESYVYTNPPQTFNQAVKQRMRWASKGLHYTLPMTVSLVSVFLFNFVLLITIPLFFLNWVHSPVILYSIVIKLIGDFFIIYHAAKLVRETKLLKYFPLVALVHIPYLIFFGLYGTFGNVKWKSKEK